MPNALHTCRAFYVAPNTVVVVDKADACLVAQFRWSLFVRGRQVYAVNQHKQFMHRVLCGLSKSDARVVDHINGNGLDNRRGNLRVCSHRQNLWNARPRVGAISPYKGVSLLKGATRRKPWKVTIQGHYVGTYRTEVEAAMAYDLHARQRFGEFARLNFPDDVAA